MKTILEKRCLYGFHNAKKKFSKNKHVTNKEQKGSATVG